VVFSRLFANESVLGVDIGSSSIKILQAEQTKQGVRITRIAACPTPESSLKDGVIVKVSEVAAAIQFAIRSAGIRASSAVAAIAGPGVIVRQIQVPKMTEQLLRKSIAFEASKYVSTSTEDNVVEFEILPTSRDDGQMDVMIVASPRAMIDSRVKTLEEAGLEPIAIDVEAFAVLRALIQHNRDQSLSDGTVAILDIGASHAEINLVCKGVLALTRTIPIAGDSLTNAVRNAMNCDESEAEQAKFALDFTEVLDIPPGATTDPCLKVAQSLVDELLREIRRSVNYYQSQLPDGSAETVIDKLILTGGSSRLKGLLPYTKSRLGMEVCSGNPALDGLVNLPGSGADLSEEDTPLLTVAYGLAVKEISSAVSLGIAV
jgi:type IV pilus assembly protein PilM